MIGFFCWSQLRFQVKVIELFVNLLADLHLFLRVVLLLLRLCRCLQSPAWYWTNCAETHLFIVLKPFSFAVVCHILYRAFICIPQALIIFHFEPPMALSSPNMHGICVSPVAAYICCINCVCWKASVPRALIIYGNGRFVYTPSPVTLTLHFCRASSGRLSQWYQSVSSDVQSNSIRSGAVVCMRSKAGICI